MKRGRSQLSNPVCFVKIGFVSRKLWAILVGAHFGPQYHHIFPQKRKNMPNAYRKHQRQARGRNLLNILFLLNIWVCVVLGVMEQLPHIQKVWEVDQDSLYSKSQLFLGFSPGFYNEKLIFGDVI